MFSELKCSHTESQSPNWAKAAHAWNDHISLLSAHRRPFIFPNFQEKLTSNFHISMAFTSVWMAFLVSFIILSLRLHSIMCWDLSQRSFLWEIFTNPRKLIILLSVLPTALLSYLRLLQITLVNDSVPSPAFSCNIWTPFGTWPYFTHLCIFST